MTTSYRKGTHLLKENRLLAFLPEAEYSRLQTSLKTVCLKKKEIIYYSGETVEYCYFPLRGIVALLATTEARKTVEVGMIGNEGMIGISAVLQIGATPYDLITQTEIEALKIDSRLLKAEFNRGESLHTILLCYIYALLCQISQSAVCHHYHSVEQRLARWLLMTKDRIQSKTFPLTQELLAYLLGIPRTHITMTACAFHRAGLINYHRGIIAITDVEGLERVACDCYHTIKQVTDEIFRQAAA